MYAKTIQHDIYDRAGNKIACKGDLYTQEVLDLKAPDFLNYIYRFIVYVGARI